MKNVIFVSEEVLYYGNTAAVTRMKLYAKALLFNKCTRVINVPFGSRCDYSNCNFIDSGIFSFSVNGNYSRSKGILLVFELFIFLFNLRNLVKKLRGDVIFYYYPSTGSLLDLVFVFYIKYILHMNIYLEVNEVRLFSSEPLASCIGRLKRQLISKLLEYTFVFYDGLICISQNIAKFYGHANSNIIIVPILCDVNDDIACHIRSFDRDLVESPIVFLFAGTVSFEKENLYELLCGFALLRRDRDDVILVFHGSISTDSMNKFQNLLIFLDISDYVRYCGPFVNGDVERIYSSADALILPRDNTRQNYYGFSTKLAEYCVSGVPIIITKTGVVTSFFRNNIDCIFVDGYSSFYFYEAFKSLLALNVKERTQLTINAFKTAKTFFDIRIHSELIQRFLK
jgi:glycosyltransferase involved in cell wall biosynthesis